MQCSAECYDLWIVSYHVQYHTELSQLFILTLAFLSFNPPISVLQQIGFIVKMEYRLDSHEGIEPEFTAVGALHRGLQAPLRFLMSVSLHQLCDVLTSYTLSPPLIASPLIACLITELEWFYSHTVCGNRQAAGFIILHQFCKKRHLILIRIGISSILLIQIEYSCSTLNFLIS